jgi:hypothetical protein
MQLKQHMPFQAGTISANVYGGTFRAFEPDRRLVGICMAEEISSKHTHIRVPTPDFDVPSIPDLMAGLKAAINAMARGNDIYVGCMGGTGRTGTFMACLAKVMLDYSKTAIKLTLGGQIDDPVEFVRATYRAHAVETPEQEELARTFDTGELVRLIATLQPAEQFAGELRSLQSRVESQASYIENLSMELATAHAKGAINSELIISLRADLEVARGDADRHNIERLVANARIAVFLSAPWWKRMEYALPGKFPAIGSEDLVEGLRKGL